MQRISRAPVLSATLRRVSAWIIGRPPRASLPQCRRSEWRASSGPLQDFHEAPALRPADWTRLDHADGVALVRLVLLVVGMKRGRGAHDLLVGAVAARDVDPHGDRLVGLRRDHNALANAGPPRAVLLSLELWRRLLRLAGALLALAQPVAATGGRAGGPCLGPRGSALLGRTRRARLARVGRALQLARLL